MSYRIYVFRIRSGGSILSRLSPKVVAMSSETSSGSDESPVAGVHAYPGTHTRGYNPDGFPGSAVAGDDADRKSVV